jgi:hypothetical protein
MKSDEMTLLRDSPGWVGKLLREPANLLWVLIEVGKAAERLLPLIGAKSATPESVGFVAHGRGNGRPMEGCHSQSDCLSTRGQPGLLRRFTGAANNVFMREDAKTYRIAQVNDKFAQALQQYDILIYGDRAYLGGRAHKSKPKAVDLTKAEFRFLVLLLRYKGKKLPTIETANRCFDANNTDYKSAGERLKHAKKRLMAKLQLSDQIFNIPRNNGDGYCCEGKFTACMFLTHELAESLTLSFNCA